MTLDDAKAYLRLETGQEDALVARLGGSAQSLCEAFLGQVLIRRNVVEDVLADGVWHRLAAGPVGAIATVVLVDDDGMTHDLPVEAYAIDIDPGGDGWVRASRGGRVRVTYRAGLAEDAASLPAAVAQGVTRLTAHLYAHRDGAAEPPAAIAALWRPFRRMRLGGGTRA